MSEVIISASVLEKLRCSICKGYLSCPPIRVSSDGSSICGRCSPTDEMGSTYRHINFEMIVKKILFPCKFQENGCEVLLEFGHTNGHEKKCSYRSVRCPFLPVCQHLWSGPILELPKHFIKNHSKLVMPNTEFEIGMGWNNERIVMIITNCVPFFIKYQYNINAGILMYDIRFIASDVQEASYKISVINSIDRDYSFTLKGDTCASYDINISNTQGSKYLFLKDYLKNLGNPERIAVELKIDVLKTKNDITNDPRVDYDVLESARCYRCRGYLIPPIYDCDKGVVCFSCSKRFPNSTLSGNAVLLEYVSKTSYPCRWHGCNLVDKGENLYKHEKCCKFRIYNCLYCDGNFKRETAVTHLNSHSSQLIFDKILYKMSFKQSPYFYRKFFMFKNNEVVYILCNTKSYCDTGNYRHSISLDCSDSSTVLNGKLYFQHSHCKVKSKIFTITRSIDIRIVHLPDCYKESDELTVSLII